MFCCMYVCMYVCIIISLIIRFCMYVYKVCVVVCVIWVCQRAEEGSYVLGCIYLVGERPYGEERCWAKGERLRVISEYVCVSLNRIDTVNCAKLLEGSLLWTVGQLFIIQRVGTVPLAPSLTGMTGSSHL